MPAFLSTILLALLAAILAGILQFFLRALGKRSISKADTAPGLRGAAWWLLTLMSAAMLLALLLAGFTIGGQPAGMAAAIAAGAPAWFALVPALLMVALLELLRNRTETYWWVLIVALVAGPLAWFYPAVHVQSGGNVAVGGGWWFSFVTGFVYCLVALYTALAHPVPLSSPLARPMYLGRHKHLNELRRFAERYGWDFRGPFPSGHVFGAAGEWDGRPAAVMSSVRLLDQPSGFVLEISLVPQWELWHFVLGKSADVNGFPDKKDRNQAMYSNRVAADGKKVDLYLWPGTGEVPWAEALGTLEQTLSAGGELLRKNTLVYVGHRAIYFRRFGAWRMMESAADLERVLAWLVAVAECMHRQEMSYSGTDLPGGPAGWSDEADTTAGG